MLRVPIPNRLFQIEASSNLNIGLDPFESRTVPATIASLPHAKHFMTAPLFLIHLPQSQPQCLKLDETFGIVLVVRTGVILKSDDAFLVEGVR